MSIIHTEELMNKFVLYGFMFQIWKIDDKYHCEEAPCQDFWIASPMRVKPLVFWWFQREWKLINSLSRSLTCVFVEIQILLSVTLCWSYDGGRWDHWRHGTLSTSLTERQFNFILKLKLTVCIYIYIYIYISLTFTCNFFICSLNNP